MTVIDDEVDRVDRFRRVGQAILPQVSQALIGGTLDDVMTRAEMLGQAAPPATTYHLGGLSEWPHAPAYFARSLGTDPESPQPVADTGIDWARFLDALSFSAAENGVVMWGGAST